MSKPIPKKLLIHEVKYIPISQEDSWGNVKSEPIKVSNVRIEDTKRFVQTTTGNKLITATILFWDKTFSTPCEFKVEDKVKWNNMEYTVNEINTYYDEARLHHLEVVLI